MSKRFLLALAVIAVVFGGLLFMTKQKDKSPSSATATPSQHVFGEGKKGVTLVEYGDFQCPYCKEYYPLVAQVKQKYQQDITFQFRNFPIVGSHPHAMEAARAAGAASLQGKFWEMHNQLYEQQDIWKNAANATATFEGYAGQLGLDVTKFKQDFASSQVKDTIDADIKEGQRIGVSGTPTFFLNGKKVEKEPRDLAEFTKLIDDAIAAKAKSAKP